VRREHQARMRVNMRHHPDGAIVVRGLVYDERESNGNPSAFCVILAPTTVANMGTLAAGVTT
jgi:hypothetical protein